MALHDRIGPLTDLLLGAAYADDHFAERERAEVLAMLEDLGALSDAVTAHINAFDHDEFDVEHAAAAFRNDHEDDRKRVLFLVAAINDADDEVDFAEDDYLRRVCEALGLPETALEGMTIDVEADVIEDALAQVRKAPPPPPPGGKK